MPRRRKSKRSKGVTTLFFKPEGLETGAYNYIDIAQCLSMMNRKLYRQGRCYYVHSIVAQLPFTGSSGGISSTLNIETVPDTWVAHKAWRHSFNLWNQMNKLVLADSPNVEGKWHDYKVFLDGAHYAGGSTDAGPTLNLLPSVGQGAIGVDTGEWNISTFVLPEHDVDIATGLPLAADEFQAHMIGADVGTPGPGTSLNSGGIIQMYGDTRAQVQGEPSVPAALSTSWGTTLTDQGSQEPELSDIIETANDEAPYKMDAYQGGATNAEGALYAAKLLSLPGNFPIVQTFNGFVAPLGLMKLTFTHNEVISTSGYNLWVNLVPGKQGGVHSTGMDA